MNPALIRAAAHACIKVYAVDPDWIFEQDGDTAILAIEGSDCALDWRRNLEFLFTSSDTHAGFQNYATLLMAEMLAEGVDILQPDQLVVTGHSLGGAVATIIASHLQEHRPDLQLVTFGSPRPGGRRFRDRLEVEHHRFVHGDDVVPRMPLAAFGFRHTDPPVVLPVPQDSLLKGIADHNIVDYAKALQ